MKAPRVVFGFHAVLARLRSHPESVSEILLDEARRDARAGDVIAAAERAGVRLIRVPVKRLDGFYGGGRHQGVVARVAAVDAGASLEEILDALDEPPLLLALDGVTDPHNLGACLRVADGAGVHAVVAPRDRSAGLTPAAIKVASGAAESVPFVTVTNLVRTLEDLKARGLWVVGADGAADADLYRTELPDALVWVLGAEGAGLRRLTREHCDLLVRIPMFGAVESLNVSVATGLCLYESRRRRAGTAPKR